MDCLLNDSYIFRFVFEVICHLVLLWVGRVRCWQPIHPFELYDLIFGLSTNVLDRHRKQFHSVVAVVAGAVVVDVVAVVVVVVVAYILVGLLVGVVVESAAAVAVAAVAVVAAVVAYILVALLVGIVVESAAAAAVAVAVVGVVEKRPILIMDLWK